MNIADLVRRLGVVGCSTEQIAVAIECFQEIGKERREKAVLRMRAVRARSRTSAHSANSPPPALSSTPPLQPSEPKKVLRAGIRHPLSDDWKPKSEIQAFPNWQQGLAEMRDWAKSNAILRNWLRRADRFNKPNGNGGHNGHAAIPADKSATNAALRAMQRSLDQRPDSSTVVSLSPRRLPEPRLVREPSQREFQEISQGDSRIRDRSGDWDSG